MIDIILFVMPKLEPHAPTAGAAVLKAHLLQAGYTAEVVDLNLALYKYLEPLNLHKKIFYSEEVSFSNPAHEPVNESYEKFYQEHKAFFMQWIDTLKAKNPKWVGMSLLSPFSIATSIKLSTLIKEHLPNVKIVWGGTAIQHDGFFNGIKAGYLDYFIKGDGEKAIIELLKGNTGYKGINQTKEFDEIPFDESLPPDFSDIDWDQYPHVFFNKPVYITASRGCVRRCTFCNDYKIWPTFRLKSPTTIAAQIDEMKTKYGRNTFLFTDSLINGNPKHYMEMLRQLKTVREKHANEIFRWSSHFIIRRKSQMPEEMFQLMAESGCMEAVIGVESFSEKVRYHMGKLFTNDDLLWCFEMLDKYNIRNQVLLVIGYATETEEDHQLNLEFIDKMFELGYAKKWDANHNAPLMRWTFGNSLLLNEKHDLFDIVKTDPSWEWYSAMNWKYKDNDMATRVRRWNESIARVQLHDPFYTPTPTTLRTIAQAEERLRDPNGSKFWSE